MLPRMTPGLVPALCALAGCQAAAGDDGPHPRLDFTRAGGFYSAPFPSDELLRSGGGVDLSAFPNPDRAAIIAQSIDLLSRDAHGFAQAGAVYLPLDADLGEAALPDLAASQASDASVFLYDLGRGRRQPVRVRYTADGGPFGAPYLLSLLPYQGVPLSPGRYAAVVTTRLHDAHGHALSPGPEMRALAAGTRPPGLPTEVFAEYAAAIGALSIAGVPASTIAGLAVFTTDAPEATFARFLDEALARPPPALAQPFARTDVFDGYCVYQGAIDLPDYQQGTPPYAHSGGDWQLDAAGRPQSPHSERARLVVTVPRAPMPAAGFPVVLLVRAGGGGDRPLVDRGTQAEPGGPAIVAGSGPAQELARVGFAGVQFDGPLGGARNTTGGDEQFLIFNVFNVAALRDNVRQSALELVLLAHLLPTLQLPSGDCPGAPAIARFDGDKQALFGHSVGATIAPLAAAAEPRFGAMILAGAGGSYIENVLWKRKPLLVLPVAETLLHYPERGRELTESDPALTVFQWATEPADPQVYARLIARPGAARHLLVEQGIVDNYILPNIANALSAPLGVDLAGPALDQGQARLAGQSSVTEALALVGRQQLALPAGGNQPGGGGLRATVLLVQHPEDGVEDGHEIIFQSAVPKRQYRCLLSGFAAGTTPVIPAAGADSAPCQ